MPGVAVGRDGQVWLGTPEGLFRVTSGGMKPHVGFPGGARQILVDPGNPSQMYALTIDGVLMVSGDGGVTWKRTLSHGLPSAPVRAVAYDPSGPIRLAALVANHGYYQSDMAGEMWMQLGAQDFPDATSMVINPLDPRGVLVGAATGLYQSTNQGTRFNTVEPSYPWRLQGPVLSMTVAGDRSSVAVVTGKGVYRSGDGGRSWQQMTDPGLSDVVSVAFHPGRSHTLAVASRNGSIAISSDRGSTWKRLQ